MRGPRERALVLFVPRLRIARAFALNYIAELAGKFEELSLPYPVELERSLRAYARGIVDWSSLKRRVERLLGFYARAWLKVEEPLVRGLRALYEISEFSITLYGTLESVNKRLEGALELARLVLRTKIGRRVELGEWMKVIGSAATPSIPRAREGSVVVVEQRPSCAHVEVLPGYVDSPADKLAKTEGSGLAEAVREYVEYVTEYVLRYRDVDEAYFRWLLDKHPETPLARAVREYLEVVSRLE